ncbi:glycosyl hydrolase [Paenibacillus sp. FSL H8-0537]|uniref:glycosyl hydrolase n=1 Tax=Paenibacillus sp. FSL H8-0537 TaxID=2921399 RepID=UPI0031017DFA
MAERLRHVLAGEEENYIMPLLWQRGEEEGQIREEMERIYASGIKAVIVESRPHPDMLGPGWWRDIDIIMDEARSRGMKVWFFDDDHFPTGHAAGKLKEAPAELRRTYLAERHIDAVGPAPQASFLLHTLLQPGDRLVAAVAVKREGKPSVDAAEQLSGFIELTASVQNNVLYWDIPAGFWRIFVLIETAEGAEEAKRNYINPIVPESTQVLIDAIYEGYYERYRDDFGKTLAGFFSDEPGFYNDKTTFDFNSRLGKKGIVLPWRHDMLELLSAEFGQPVAALLPLLWYEGGEQTEALRYTFMNTVSKLYAEHFCGKLGDWCRERGVEYIGHIIEDNNVHARLGCGPGHFFRSMWGQDMAGIDVVLHQIMPGFDEVPFTWIAGETDSEFFHYALAKLGSSLAHIDPKKKGRAMCEVFGAYGWSEGLKLMKWLTDHMLVRGINYFVPHAFSQKEFPDADCPPHLYARGENPQYRYYRQLNDYTNRISHLLNGGRHYATAAVLYHADAEWSGAEAMLIQKPIKALMQAQIDCDIIPFDILASGAFAVKDGELLVAKEEYQCLIVPYAEALPAVLMEQLAELAEAGLKVLFVDGLPARTIEGGGEAVELKRLKALEHAAIVPLAELAATLRYEGMYDIETADAAPYLRYYHYGHPDSDVYFFFNEHPYETVDTDVSFQTSARMMIYNAFDNQLSEASVEQADGVNRLRVRLSAYETLIVLSGEALPQLAVQTLPDCTACVPVELTGEWTVATSGALQYPVFESYGNLSELENINAPHLLPDFTGTIRYELSFDWNGEGEPLYLDLGAAFETAEASVNGVKLGTAIAPPYRFAAGANVQPGTNQLVIEVTNTLGKQQKDFFSRFMQQEPGGLIGPVQLLVKSKD